MTREARNEAAILGLHPQFAVRVRILLGILEPLGVLVLITQGRRTFQEQAALYAQGRTVPGPVVTNARAGLSFHQYGLAIDVVDVGASGDERGYDPSDYAATNYPRIADEGRKLGMEWGGTWRTIKDEPHLEYHPGLGPSDAMTLAAHCDENERLPEDFFDVPGVTNA